MRSTLFVGVAALAMLSGVMVTLGCRRETQPTVVQFEPNWVYAYLLEQQTGESMDQALKETQAALRVLFGTPDAPKIPEVITKDEELAAVISMDHLTAASGPPNEQGRGLYRKHCAVCHGVTGNGRGPTAALIDPYPRDFRLGKFKFKSTPIGVKPTKEDLAKTIRNGIPGTAMVKIPELTDEDIVALVDYVIYLSMRGETERNLLFEASQLDYEGGETLYDPSLKESDPEQFEEQWEIIEDYVLDVADAWSEAPERVKPVPPRDPSVVPDTIEDVLAKLAAGDSVVKASVERGHELFLTEKAACWKCHGKQGRGDGQTDDYDDWTKDWTLKFGLKPDDRESLIPLMARGALPPRKARPRNFEEGIFRGGSAPEEIYKRIALGIEGTPMPAAPLQPNEIWDLVNFVRSLYKPKPEDQQPATEQVAAQQTSMTR